MPWTQDQIAQCIKGLKRSAGDEHIGAVVWPDLSDFLARSAHLPAGDWAQTRRLSREFKAIVGTPKDAAFRAIFARVLEGGGWDAAAAAVKTRAKARLPFLVLVAGLNGIRKTTAVNARWFAEALRAAAPPLSFAATEGGVPCGRSAFFRQLDFMVATLASEEFRALYADFSDDVDRYAKQKQSLFAQYRQLAEILGVLLVDEALARGMDVFAETSGRSSGSFHYIDFLASERDGGPKGRSQATNESRAAAATEASAAASVSTVRRANKLVARFEVNDVRHAKRSVASRMTREIAEGRSALASGSHEACLVANRGGPYGPSVLTGVEAASKQVWSELEPRLRREGWIVASFLVEANDDDAEWVLKVVKDAPRATKAAAGAGVAAAAGGAPAAASTSFRYGGQ